MPIKLYSYAAKPDVDPTVTAKLAVDGESISEYKLSVKGSFKGGIFDLGCISIAMPDCKKAAKAVLTINFKDICNKYILWVYPNTENSQPENVTVTSDWNNAKTALEAGGRVLFTPENLNDENSVEGTYCTDFWNYPMFRSISESMKKPVPVGTLGLLIDSKHPSLAEFPSETYSTAQWYDIVNRSRTVILDGTDIDPIVRTIDNCERNHSLGTVFEVKTGGGSLLVCSAKLDGENSPLPCSQLLKSLTDYAASDSFKPVQTADISVLDNIFR